MSHFSSPSESSLLVRDARGRYLLATADQILLAARQWAVWLLAIVSFAGEAG